MAGYLFYNGDVCIQDHDGVACVPWDDACAAFMRRDKSAHIVIVENAEADFFDRVRRIRQAFTPGTIKTFISYAAAMRAFVQERSLSPVGESVMVVDDLGEKVFLTALTASQAGLTRVIPAAGPEKIMDEIRRTQRNVTEKSSTTAMRVLSNYPGLPEAIDLGMKFPAFDVLGRIRFPSQLMPPEDVARAGRQKLLKEFLLVCLTSALIAATGIGFWIYARGQERAAHARAGHALAIKATAAQAAARLGALTYQYRLRAMPQVDLAGITDVFIRHTPPDGRVEVIAFERDADMDWALEGTIMFPRQRIFPFTREDIFSAATVQDIFVQGRPGKRVRVDLGRRTLE